MTVLFENMGFHPTILNSLNRLNFTTPTPIQEHAIPIALTGKDIIGSAQTGTGKTFAYAIPVINGLFNNPNATAMVLTPTRELATQVLDSIRKLLDPQMGIKTALIIGGESYTRQFAQLKAKPQIVVGTPGRIIDHFNQKTLNGKNMEFLVLDETDRMFDMGFGIQLNEILQFIPEKRQTFMFSATFPPKVDQLSAKYLINPEKVFLESNQIPTDRLKQESLKVKESQKFDILVEQLNIKEGSKIIFVKTKSGAEDLAQKLRIENMRASAIHGDLKQRKRDMVIKDFRKGKSTIMVATDVAARGLDIPHVQHVINYDLPTCPEDYVHRIGRTARAGAEGFALNLIAPHDNRKWDMIQRLVNPEEYKNSPQRKDFSDGPSNSGFKKKPSFKKFGDDRKRTGFKSDGFRSDSTGFKKSDGFRSDSSGFKKADGFRSDSTGFKKADGFRSDSTGFKKADGFRSDSTGFKKADGFRSDSTGFKKSEGFRSDSSGFKKADGFRSDSTGFKKSEGFRSDSSGFPKKSGFKSDSQGFKKSEGFRSERSSFQGKPHRKDKAS